MKFNAAERSQTCRRTATLNPAPSALALVVGCSIAADAASFSGDGWTVDLSGDVNGLYLTTSCSGGPVGATALAGEVLGCG